MFLNVAHYHFVLFARLITFFSNPGSGIKDRLSAPKILSRPTSEAAPSTVMSDFSALGSLCSAYASDSEDDEEPAGMFKYDLLRLKFCFIFSNPVDWKVSLFPSVVHANG